jgi:Phage gp6-like head-tail connector protein
MAIVTLTAYKTWAGITGTSDDTRLQVLLDSAHAAVRRYCGRDLSNGFEAATRTQDYTVNTYEMQLEEFPLTSITSIKQYNLDNTLGDAIDSTEYYVELDTGIVRWNGAQNSRVFIDTYNNVGVLNNWNWRPNFQRVQVVYVTGAPPADVKTALYRMVDGLYASIRKDMGIASQSLGGWSVTYASPDLAAKAQASLLDPFGSGKIWG